MCLSATVAELADVEFSLIWRDAEAAHRDRRLVAAVAPAHDLVAGTPLAPLLAIAPGIPVALTRGLLLGPAQPEHRMRLPRTDWPAQIGGHFIAPSCGRWFPRQVLAGRPGVAAGGPLRVVAAEGNYVEIDLSPPLTGVTIAIEACIVRKQQGSPGAPRDLLPLLVANGPGMQAVLPHAAADLPGGDALARGDEAADPDFYAQPRLVDHLDATALDELARLHGRFLRPGQQVLDLMASCNSHLPEHSAAIAATGLGMNAEELAANSRLVERRVHDLNADPALPFADSSFDLVLCALSVEYLTKPLAVFREVARVLKPGGIYLVTFSERWFPSKAIKLWGELHPFERMGLVLDYFRRSGSFTALNTESLRGLPRPPGDKYITMTKLSDPIYAVWGSRS